MNTKVTLIYDRRKDGRNTFEYKVYFPEEKKNLYIPTHVSVEPEYFDSELNLISTEVKDYLIIKNKLKRLEHKIKDVLMDLSARGEVTKDNFKKEFNKKKKVQKKAFGIFNEFMSKEIEKDTSLSSTTKINHLQAYNLLQGYNKRIKFDDINFKLASDIGKYLREKYDNPNTIAKHFAIIKRYVKLANRFGFINSENANSFLAFKTITKQTNKEVVTPDEINKIMSLKYPEGSNDYNVQAMFLFSFFTALRVSDIQALTKDNFKEENGELSLSVEVKKLKRYGRKIRQNLTKSFSGQPERIIRPFLDKANSRIFKHILEKEILISLKRIIKDAGINKHITFHCARHSGITWVANKTKDISAVMEFGGITNIGTAQKYIHLTESYFQDKINNLEWHG